MENSKCCKVSYRHLVSCEVKIQGNKEEMQKVANINNCCIFSSWYFHIQNILDFLCHISLLRVYFLLKNWFLRITCCRNHLWMSYKADWIERLNPFRISQVPCWSKRVIFRWQFKEELEVMSRVALHLLTVLLVATGVLII